MRRFACWLLDTGPVLVLAAIAGAGSFTHIRDTAIEHGQSGWMSWAVAVCIDLTCVMAANLAQADPTAWGWITAATPAAAFLIAVSMLERRATRPEPSTAVASSPVLASSSAPELVPSHAQDEDDERDSDLAPALIDYARRVADEHHTRHGKPITRDALRAHLGVSNQLASDLLRTLRTA
ncbi:DUF2637 domain-containing protein [Nonomuraea sp. NPDC049655]|uniref:DUF2637 domain-containing protein n=1 Tax=Nonomuraea sp. NPDC049655 TaxID=3364355 RepID=UPI0037A5A9EF